MQSSVLGKRSQSSTDSPSCPRDLPTPEVTPTAKRIKTTSTFTDPNPDGNKENIPPLPQSPSPRRLRRTVTESPTSPRNARSKSATRFPLLGGSYTYFLWHSPKKALLNLQFGPKGPLHHALTLDTRHPSTHTAVPVGTHLRPRPCTSQAYIQWRITVVWPHHRTHAHKRIHHVIRR